jgi:hypothetical protein
MRCEKAKRLVSDALDDELSPKRLARLEAHLGKCTSCRAYRRSLELIHAEAAKEAPPAPDQEYWGDFVRGLSRKIDALDVRRRPRPKPAPLSPWLRPALAAGLVGLVVLAAFILLSRRSPLPEEFAYLHSEDSLSGVLEAAASDPELGNYLALEVSSSIADAAPIDAAGEPFLAVDEPFFWESLSEEELAAIAADLEKDNGQGEPQ